MNGTSLLKNDGDIIRPLIALYSVTCKFNTKKPFTMTPKTALLIIDVQNNILWDTTSPRGQAAANALDVMVARLATVLARARAQAMPVLHIQHNAPADHRLATGTPGWHIRDELTPLPNEQVLQKTDCDAFYETRLEQALRSAGITRLIIGGCMTPYCIDTSVRRALSLGFDVILAEDGHTTQDSETLGFEQIVAHHTAVLSGITAGAARVVVKACGDLPGAV
jgi:nicotinamidase-related amidase